MIFVSLLICIVEFLNDLQNQIENLQDEKVVNRLSIKIIVLIGKVVH